MRYGERNDGKPTGRIDRVFRILDAFGGVDDSELSLAELARRTGIPKPTVYRIVSELADWGALERVKAGYRLGTRLFELGGSSPRERNLREAALPFMEDLYEATHETIHLAVLEDTTTLIVEKIAGHRRTSAPSRVGGRGPAHCTGLGKAILAFSPRDVVDRVVDAGLQPWTPYTIVVPSVLREHLAQIASRGVAIEREESTIGVVCAAAPVFGRSEEILAAISVAAPVHRIDPERLAPAVRTAALSLSRTIASAS